ncbi:hypothetical protein pipiens_019340, partial [Culex pipiens pipiens]
TLLQACEKLLFKTNNIRFDENTKVFLSMDRLPLMQLKRGHEPAETANPTLLPQ